MAGTEYFGENAVHHAEIAQSHTFAALIRLSTTTHNLLTFNTSEISSITRKNSAYWQINTSGRFSYSIKCCKTLTLVGKF